MNRQAVAQKLVKIAKSLAAASHPAILIDSHRQPMARLNKLTSELVRGFEDAQAQLAGLRRSGAGDTEADTLLRDIVVPRPTL